MNASILALATAVPPFFIEQGMALDKILEIFSYDPKKEDTVRKAYQNSGIHKRHVITDDHLKEPQERLFLGPDYPKSVPGMTQRNEIYKREAPLLAHRAAEQAIEAWGGDPSSITHLISISCTGVVIPGIEFSLMVSLKLNPSLKRLGINFMGCFGAFKGLEIAHTIAKESKEHRVLVVCTELCSLHIQADDSPDSVMANSIFADGAAAVVVGCCPRASERSLWQMIRHSSFGLPDSEQQMRWEASDHGFVMKLSSFVPVTLSRHIRPFVDRLLSPYAAIADCDWPIHPGGKAIIQTVEKKLGLEPCQTEASWHTLAHYGNMSSATFLFALDRLQSTITKGAIKPWTVGIGFGPGLSVEGILLQRGNNKEQG